MRIVIEAPDDLAELLQARQAIDALLHPLMFNEPARAPVVRDRRSPVRLRELVLSVRTLNALAAESITTLDSLLKCRTSDLMRLPGFGRKSLDEVRGALESRGQHLQPDNPECQA